MNEAFVEYFRCPELFSTFELAPRAVSNPPRGYFNVGPDVICYGTSPMAVTNFEGQHSDAIAAAQIDGTTCRLPFSPTEVADNLRLERYYRDPEGSFWRTAIRKTYYALRPLFPVVIRRHLQRAWLNDWKNRSFPSWPVDRSVDQMFEALMRLAVQTHGSEIPFIWFWPDAKSSCAVMTHDVETAAGLTFTPQLMDINDSFAIKSSFQLIPNARYLVSSETLTSIRMRGFEVNVHDLKHDGQLYQSHEHFQQSAIKINGFAAQFKSDGFRSGALYRNQEWYQEFRFSYDMSVPNVAHLDPQRGGCCTVMPYFVGDVLELPVTTIQDYTLFNVLKTYSLDLWREQIDLIMKQHGLISFIIHPDYIQTTESKNAYVQLLAHLSDLRANAKVWVTLPGEVNTWWRQRGKMQLVRNSSGWHIEGTGAERATIAYAVVRENTLQYRFEVNCPV